MTQEGEKEIVLGNKQLISLFFVVVALCGVFFALGYMMGGNRSRPAAAIPETTAATLNTSTISPSPAPAAQDSEPPRETAPDTTAAGPPPVEPASAESTPPPTTAVAAPTVQTKPAI